MATGTSGAMSGRRRDTTDPAKTPASVAAPVTSSTAGTSWRARPPTFVRNGLT